MKKKRSGRKEKGHPHYDLMRPSRVTGCDTDQEIRGEHGERAEGAKKQPSE